MVFHLQLKMESPDAKARHGELDPKSCISLWTQIGPAVCSSASTIACRRGFLKKARPLGTKVIVLVRAREARALYGIIPALLARIAVPAEFALLKGLRECDC